MNAEDLKVDCIMDFSSNPKMYEALKQTYANDDSWEFYSNNLAVLTFQE